MGAGVGSAIFADISRVTTVNERTGVMSIFIAIRQLGLLAGMNTFLIYSYKSHNAFQFKLKVFNTTYRSWLEFVSA